MTDARFGPGLRAVLTTPEHSMMMDTIEKNLTKWIARFDYYKEQNEQAVIETAEQGGQTARVLVTLKATQIARRIVRLTEGFITLANSYHGETLGALAVGDVELYKAIYKPLLMDVRVVGSPDCYVRERGATCWTTVRSARAVLPPPKTTSSPGTVRSRSISHTRLVSARRNRSPTVGPYSSA